MKRKERELLSKIENYCNKADIRYEKNGRNGFIRTAFDIGSVVGNVTMIIQIFETGYLVMTMMSSHASKDIYAKIAEKLCQINVGLLSGNFDIDMKDGEISYRLYVELEGMEVTDEVIEKSIYIPLMTIEQYGEEIIAAMLSDKIIKTLK